MFGTSGIFGGSFGATDEREDSREEEVKTANHVQYISYFHIFTYVCYKKQLQFHCVKNHQYRLKIRRSFSARDHVQYISYLRILAFTLR